MSHAPSGAHNTSKTKEKPGRARVRVWVGTRGGSAPQESYTEGKGHRVAVLELRGLERQQEGARTPREADRDDHWRGPQHPPHSIEQRTRLHLRSRGAGPAASCRPVTAESRTGRRGEAGGPVLGPVPGAARRRKQARRGLPRLVPRPQHAQRQYVHGRREVEGGGGAAEVRDEATERRPHDGAQLERGALQHGRLHTAPQRVRHVVGELHLPTDLENAVARTGEAARDGEAKDRGGEPPQQRRADVDCDAEQHRTVRACVRHENTGHGAAEGVGRKANRADDAGLRDRRAQPLGEEWDEWVEALLPQRPDSAGDVDGPEQRAHRCLPGDHCLVLALLVAVAEPSLVRAGRRRRGAHAWPPRQLQAGTRSRRDGMFDTHSTVTQVVFLGTYPPG
eukprot:scaffold11828_cov63-Phaeocystis_antarctica.AAC.1